MVLLAALVCLVQWVWSRFAGHVDLRLMPACSRRRVRWLLTNSMHIQLAALVLLAGALCVQGGLAIS